MDKYALAKVLQWAGEPGVAGRKRLQKVVFFLQKAGCPFGADYTLHHYGPYSRDVAEACDELVAAKLVDETQVANVVGSQYTYVLGSAGKSALLATEARIGSKVAKVESFKSLAAELLGTDLWDLELGSTILYFREKTADWDDAVRKAHEFKKVNRQKDIAVSAATKLAQKVFVTTTGPATTH